MLGGDDLLLHLRGLPLHDEPGLSTAIVELDVERIVPRGEVNGVDVGCLLPVVGPGLDDHVAVEVHAHPVVMLEGEGVIILHGHVEIPAPVDGEAVTHLRGIVVAPGEVDGGVDPGVLEFREILTVPVVPEKAVRSSRIVSRRPHDEVLEPVAVRIPQFKGCAIP